MTEPRIDTLLMDLSRFVEQAADGQLGPVPEAMATALRDLRARCAAVELRFVEPVLTLSTAHVTEADDTALRDGFCPPTCLISQTSDHGYTLLVIDTEIQPANPNPAPGLETVIEYARSLGCTYIRFDGAGFTLDALPIYDW